MSNVKPGDMARFVEPHEYAGMVVEVLAPMSDEDRKMLIEHAGDYQDGMVIWLCKIFGGGLCRRVLEGRREYVYPGAESLAYDAYLRRIDPRDLDEDIHETLEKEIHA